MSQPFSGIQRSVILDQMAEDDLDVLIIGGGITGAGTALDAQARGMNVGLLEMQDFASGTSSRSTKLVHGGLRYLKQFEVKMVAEVGKERAIVYENAPHVTTPLWMMLPLIKGGTFGKFSTGIGLSVYDRLAGVRRHERRHMLKKEDVLQKEPLIRQKDLKGGGYYVEYRTDDARLTLETMKAAVARGTKALNYVKAESLLYDDDGHIIGVLAVDQLTGERHNIYAKKIVNAAGPWSDDLREKDQSKDGKQLHLTKGVHITIDGDRFPLQQAVYFDTHDGRMVFAIPREGKAYIGTTDTNETADLEHPRMTVEDRDYLLDAANFMFPDVALKAEDVESSWAGYRPLIHEEGKDPSEISRKDEIFHSDSGLITIAGGKLTGYRKMAERVIDLVAQEFKDENIASYGKCPTKHIHLSGGDVNGSDAFPHFVGEKIKTGTDIGLTSSEAERLVNRYGSNVDALFDIIQTRGEEAQHYHMTKEVFAMIVYGIEQEMVATPEDFFIRRTGAMFFHIDFVYQWKDIVTAYMAQRLHWSETAEQHYKDLLAERIQEATVPQSS